MTTVSVDKKNNKKALSEAILLLEKNETIIIPTDTVYGLAADALSEAAVGRLLTLKERALEKGLPLFVSSIEMARRLAYIDKQKEDFLRKVWPGQVTVIVQAKDIVPKFITGGRDTVALRMPDYQFVIDIASALGRPITGTSANISGNMPIRDIEEAVSQWDGKDAAPAAAFNAGPLTQHPPSTIVDITNSKPIILRQGVMSKDELDRMMLAVVRK